MSIPKEPRQMMINMMYLVLTAMLALNVSAEILNAFKIVDDGIKRTNSAIAAKNASMYAAFDKKAADDPTAVDEKDAAYEIKSLADNLIDEIDVMITDIQQLVGVQLNDQGQPTDELKNPKDTHKGTRYLIVDGNADKLKTSILDTRTKMLSFFDENVRESRAESLPLNAEDPAAKEGVQRTWGEFNFYEVPAVAQITVLNKIKNDVRNSEAQLLEYLGARINADKFTFDALKGRAISNNPYVNQGETYEADIFVSATSSATNPKVHIGTFTSAVEKDDNGDFKEIKGGPIPLTNYKTYDESEGGIVKYSATASSTGKKTYTGVIEIVNPNTGETSYYPFQGEYTVAGSMAVVSPEKMNVFYIGVDNPVSVSAPGFQPQQITPSISSGTITSRGEAGKYTVRVSEAGDVKITLTGKKDGDVSRIGSADFRVKRIPDPNIYAGNRKSGVIGAGELRALTGIYAKADGFDFDVRFEIIGFEFTYKKARQNQLRIIENRGTLFNPEIKDILKNVSAGDQVWLDNIRVKSPDNTTRVANMSLKVI